MNTSRNTERSEAEIFLQELSYFRSTVLDHRLSKYIAQIRKELSPEPSEYENSIYGILESVDTWLAEQHDITEWPEQLSASVHSLHITLQVFQRALEWTNDPKQQRILQTIIKTALDVSNEIPIKDNIRPEWGNQNNQLIRAMIAIPEYDSWNSKWATVIVRDPEVTGRLSELWEITDILKSWIPLLWHEHSETISDSGNRFISYKLRILLSQWVAYFKQVVKGLVS